MPGQTVKERPLRRDAQANRERIVAAARAVFAAQGIEATVEEIARRAGVGMGTLYRRFPTKEDLVDAVLEDAFGQFVHVAEEALAEDDAWAGFTGFLERSLALHGADRGLKDLVDSSEHGRVRADALRARWRPLIRRLVERAQEQGSLRADFTPEDVRVVFWTAGRVIEATAEVAPDFWRRYLALLLDGLRAGAATPLPHSALTRAQLDRAAGRKAS
ncbi:MAG: TetR/AcrR family transcriptional regulator [Gaiellaceae bacterium]